MATVAALALTGTTNTGAARLASGLLIAVAPPAIAIGVIRGLRARGHTTVQAVLGVLSFYLMIGMFCAFAYGTIDNLGGAPVFANDVTATTAHCLYFSFVTLTTVGYGDVLTRSDLGHTLAVTEALVGQIYLVTVVALLVSDLGSRRTPAPRRPETYGGVYAAPAAAFLAASALSLSTSCLATLSALAIAFSTSVTQRSVEQRDDAGAAGREGIGDLLP